MKMCDAWNELKERLTVADVNFRNYSEKMHWLEQTGDSIFSDILKLMDELEEKYE